MLFKTTLAALLLACSVSAVPDGKVVLGYRTCSTAEAEKINAAGAPVWDTDRMYGGGKQIGAGVYTTPKAGQWRQIKKIRPYVCVIYADKERLLGKDGVSKLWVPYKLGDKVLWADEGAAIPDYVKSLPWNWNPEKTLYMAWIQDYKDQVQLLIPPGLVAAEGALGLTAVCKENIADLPDRADVNYDDWQENIRGERGPQVDSLGNPLK